MDLTAAFAFLDSDSDDDEAPIPLSFPPSVVPDFFEEDNGESDNMVLLSGMAAHYAANIQSGVRGSDSSKIDEWHTSCGERVRRLKRQWLKDRSV